MALDIEKLSTEPQFKKKKSSLKKFYGIAVMWDT